MMLKHGYSIDTAIYDFYKARRKAGLEEILARVQGKSASLLMYDEIRSKLGATESGIEHLEDIPLDSIIGSVSRVSDFSRSFLPLKDSDRDRWANVKVVHEEEAGLPPIEVYQIGEVYFVRDGHHRISIVREMGGTYIQAYVTRVNTSVPFRPDDNPDEVILRAEYQDFINKTHIDQLLPEASIRVSAPGLYPEILEHISVHRYYMGIEQKREIHYPEAVLHWYERVYLPIAQIIRSRRWLKEFPDRTETDLYLWLMAHRVEIGESIGWQVSPAAAAKDLENRYSRSRLLYFLGRLPTRFVNWLIPEPLDISPEPGEWRRSHGDSQPNKITHLFEHILVAVNGQPEGWSVVDYAVELASLEGAWLNGLLIARDKKDIHSDRSVQIKAEFQEHCSAKGVNGGLAVETGKVARQIAERSFWNDLTIVHLRYPPPMALIPRLSSGFRLLIRQCYSPLLALTDRPFTLKSMLLAYDGSPKANEALYVAAYMAQSWSADLTVLTAMKNITLSENTSITAKNYLEQQGITAKYIITQGRPASHILENSQSIDIIIMGGYGGTLLSEIFFGSTVDRVLQSSKKPVLICH